MRDIIFASVIFTCFILSPAKISNADRSLHVSHHEEEEWKICFRSATETVIELEKLNVYIFGGSVVYNKAMEKVLKVRGLLDITGEKCSGYAESMLTIPEMYEYLDKVEGLIKRREGIFYL